MMHSLTLWQLPNDTEYTSLAYVLKTSDGHVAVIDGGHEHDMPQLLALLREVCGGKPRIDAWLLTHAHNDHAAGLASLIQNKTLPETGKIYFSFPPAELICSRERKWAEEQQIRICGILENHPHVIPVAGMKIPLGDSAMITVLNSLDLAIPSKDNFGNNAGIVYRVDTSKTGILFPGDIADETGDVLLRTLPPELLRADAVQVSHHGQNGVGKNFYEAVNPRICLWPIPEFSWKCKRPGLRTEETRTWFRELGVSRHYVACRDGLVRLDFP